MWRRAKRPRLGRTGTRFGGSVHFSAGSWGLGRRSMPTAHPQQAYLLCRVFAKRGSQNGKCDGGAPQVPKFLHKDGSSPGNIKPCPTSRSPRSGYSKAQGGDLRLGYVSPTCSCLHPHLPVETLGQSHSLVLFRHFHYLSLYSQPQIIPPMLRQVNPSPT